jgi:hypothetical protein
MLDGYIELHINQIKVNETFQRLYIYQPGNGDELPRICNLSKGKGI